MDFAGGVSATLNFLGPPPLAILAKLEAEGKVKLGNSRISSTANRFTALPCHHGAPLHNQVDSDERMSCKIG